MPVSWVGVGDAEGDGTGEVTATAGGSAAGELAHAASSAPASTATTTGVRVRTGPPGTRLTTAGDGRDGTTCAAPRFRRALPGRTRPYVVSGQCPLSPAGGVSASSTVSRPRGTPGQAEPPHQPAPAQPLRRGDRVVVEAPRQHDPPGGRPPAPDQGRVHRVQVVHELVAVGVGREDLGEQPGSGRSPRPSGRRRRRGRSSRRAWRRRRAAGWPPGRAARSGRARRDSRGTPDQLGVQRVRRGLDPARAAGPAGPRSSAGRPRRSRPAGRPAAGR